MNILFLRPSLKKKKKTNHNSLVQCHSAELTEWLVTLLEQTQEREAERSPGARFLSSCRWRSRQGVYRFLQFVLYPFIQRGQPDCSDWTAIVTSVPSNHCSFYTFWKLLARGLACPGYFLPLWQDTMTKAAFTRRHGIGLKVSEGWVHDGIEKELRPHHLFHNHKGRPTVERVLWNPKAFPQWHILNKPTPNPPKPETMYSNTWA